MPYEIFHKPSTSNEKVFPSITPRLEEDMTASSSSFDVFEMILNDGQRFIPRNPVIDLEAEVLTEIQNVVAESPAAKRRREVLTSANPASNVAVKSEDECEAMWPQFGGAINLDEIGEYKTIPLEVDKVAIEVTDENMPPGGTMVHGNDDEDGAICWNGLTTLAEFEKRRRRARTVRSRLLTHVGLKRKPSSEDALSKAAMEINGEAARFWDKFTVPPYPTRRKTVVRICSYHVLCHMTTENRKFLYEQLSPDDSSLKWENRWPILKEELQSLNADIFGLQEVQRDHFERDFGPSMCKEGYATYYTRKTGLSWDGCAVFVRRSKLKIISHRTVEYFVGPGTSMDRDQIGQILRIRSKETRQEFLFVNTHLLFDPSRGDIKLGQLAMLIANIEDELSKSRCPVILCGDFNIEPHSYIYKYIIESSVCLRGLYCSELSGQGLFGGPHVEADRILPPVTNIGRDSMFINNEAYREPVNADYFTHPLRLASVYRHVSVNGEKEISTFHKEVANPDFLFYSVTQKLTTDSNTLVHEDPELRLLRRLSLPDIPTLRKNCGPWPNHYVPSDHVPLVADFILSNSEICSIPN